MKTLIAIFGVLITSCQFAFEILWACLPHKAHRWHLSRLEYLKAKCPENGRVYDSTYVKLYCRCGCEKHVVFYGKNYSWREARRHIG